MQDAALLSSAQAVVGVWAVTVMTPGPNVIATIHVAGTASPRQGPKFAADR